MQFYVSFPFLGETSNHETRKPTIFTDEDGSRLDFPVLVSPTVDG